MTGWDDLVTAALLGTGRRVPDLTALPGSAGSAGRAAARLPDREPAAALLDAAALVSAERRAGWMPLRSITPPAAAAEDTAPAVPPAARVRLHDLLVSGDRDLLLQWLAGATAGGWRVSEPELPTVLDAAAADRRIAAAARPVLGERGRWLAALRPEWRALVTDPIDVAATDPALWRLGDPEQRRAYLAALRERDAAAARALLAESWRQETASDRASFVGLLAARLSLADEALLEAALDDRSGDVRNAAAGLLARLPGSALARRMAARADTYVRVERKLMRQHLVVTPPAERDAAMARDGVVDPPRTRTGSGPLAGLGAGAFLLVQVLAATPLRTWTDRFGHDPDTVLRLPVADGWSDVLRIGWTRAAVAQADPAWARPLLAQNPDSAEAAGLLCVLPPGERGDITAGLLDRCGSGPRVAALLRACPDPWSGRLAAAVLNWLASCGDRPHAVRDVLRLAGLRLPTDATGRVRAIAALQPADSAWQRALLDVADRLTYRSEMLQELH